MPAPPARFPPAFTAQFPRLLVCQASAASAAPPAPLSPYFQRKSCFPSNHTTRNLLLRLTKHTMRNQLLAGLSSLLLLAALVFLVLSLVSVPVALGLHLASTSKTTYGIFGLCSSSSSSTPCLQPGYPISLSSITDGLFLSDTRNTLAKTFIVAPIAAGLVFFALLFTLVSICVSASCVKIFSLILGVVAAIATIFISIVEVLVYYPHVEWLGWLQIVAAAFCLISLLLLFLSIRVKDSAVDDSDDDSIEQMKFGKLKDGLTFNMPEKHGLMDKLFDFADDDHSKDYGYRGPEALNHTFGTQVKVLQSPNSSILESRPNQPSDVTRSNAPPRNPHNYPSLNQGPGLPVAARRQMAPTFQASAGTPSYTESPLAAKAPYPPTERTSAILNSVNYGVFDHHPNVEGHQPFTEMPDKPDENDRNSLSSSRQLDSDEESDFTSVSQRPPNAMYTSPKAHQYHDPSPQNYLQGYPQGYSQGHLQGYQQGPPQGYQQGPPQGYLQGPPQGYQQSYPNMAHYLPSNSNQERFAKPAQSAYPSFQPSQPNQLSRPANRPTISDNALNTNPDFSLGLNNRRRVGGPRNAGFQPGARAGPGRAGAREGPYMF